MIPLIAVLTGHHPADRASVHRTYLNAVWLAGGQPVILSPPPTGALNSALGVLEHCDGLLITGGGDLEPERYGESEGTKLMQVDQLRDTFELAAVDRSIAVDRPILGICRGMQVMAVALGGRLHQDVADAGFSDHWQVDHAFSPVHQLKVEQESLIGRVLGDRDTVNSVHHQAVADPGPHLVATAWSHDGLIEAVEGADGHPMLGVQWHPERLACPPEPAEGDPEHLAVFRWLTEAATRRDQASAFRRQERDVADEPLVHLNGRGNGQITIPAGQRQETVHVPGEESVTTAGWGG